MIGLVSSVASSSRSFLFSAPHFPTPFTASGSLRRVHGGDTRWVKTKPRPARMPLLRSPHHPRPSTGKSANIPHPDRLQKPSSPPKEPTTTRVPLAGTQLTFHHTPPSSAPTYTTGSAPDLLRWLAGEQVRLSGEEQAPLVIRRTKTEAGNGVERTWTEEQQVEMRQMRLEGKSRLEIAKHFGLSPLQAHLIARIAPLSREQVKEIERFNTELEQGMRSRKQISLAVRRKRKLYW